MKYYLRLDILTDNTIDTYNKITNILGWTPTQLGIEKHLDTRYSVWSYSVDIGEADPYFDFINIFLDRLEPKFINLEKLGVTKDNITFWLLYEYDQQCNLEFDPQRLKRLGDNGISLCISCWDSGQEYKLTNDQDVKKSTTA
jgi:hypothetical protein